MTARASREDPAGADRAAGQRRRDDICIHIFTVSATLVGVCLTVIGVLRFVGRLQALSSIADNILSIDAAFFLAATIVSYVALRTADDERRRKIERVADGVFLFALLLMTAVACLIAYELI